MSSAAPAERRQSDYAGFGYWVLLPFAVLATIFLYPLSLIVHEALTVGTGAISIDGLRKVMGSAIFVSALFNTVRIALIATLGCLTLGFTLALIYSFVPFPGRALVAKMLDTFIALPTFLVALAFTFIYGSAGLINHLLMTAMGTPVPPVNFLYSSWGVILAEITVYSPFVLRPLIASFSLLDPALIEVASSLGARPLRVVREIIFPAALPALLAGGSLCLLLTVNEFGIVLFIGAKGVITLPLLVYDKAIQQFDYTSACVIASVNILLSLLLYSLYRVAISGLGGQRAAVV
ncbi:MAG: 2-aminoethylphosphonate ABC transporter permease subunit [Bradyrhizobium sp.]|nr:2-aminoethylphosphonate ABC transporter permease subunit [Bradyrhizobium sp.]